MPNVVGSAYTDAARALAEFKVRRSEVASAEVPVVSVAQSPAAGRRCCRVTLCHCRYRPVLAGRQPRPPPRVRLQRPRTFWRLNAGEKTEARRGIFRGVVAIGAAVVLGLIFGALFMRHRVLRQRAVAAADEAIISMSPAPSTITSVDILLEEDAEPERVDASRIEAPPPEPQSKKLGEFK